MDHPSPQLRLEEANGISYWTDNGPAGRGVIVGFSQRNGGVSAHPYAALNLADHVGDEGSCVDENRTRLLDAAGLGRWRGNLVVAEQVHGERVTLVGLADAGSGAFASGGRHPIPATDALVTMERGVPLMLCFADCVPIVLVAPGPAVAVVHAGWRGALASLPGKAARELARVAECGVSDVFAYIGAHIGACHYPVSDDVMSHFCNTFGTVARADSGGLDLDAAVTASLVDAGVAPCSIARLGTCTAEATDRFFSYRSEDGRTGRHSAFACIV